MSTQTINQSFLGIEKFSSSQILLVPQISGLLPFSNPAAATTSPSLPVGALYQDLSDTNAVRVKVA